MDRVSDERGHRSRPDDNLKLTIEGDNIKLSIVEVIDIGALANAVRERAAGEPLDRIEAAMTVSEELASGADDLIGQFVAEARQAGCSWTEIGQRIGVSKQAARQRFAQSAPAVGDAGMKRDPRLLACLALAGREAAASGAAEIGTQHQLIALFHDPVTAAILDRLGARAEAVRAAAGRMFSGGDAPAGQAPPQSAEAEEALRRAAALARRSGCGWAGPEHLLCALASDPGARARQVLTGTGVSASAIRRELARYVVPDKARRRRRGKAGIQCSFCGKPGSAELRLIAGPGVYICAECIALCNEILAEEAASLASSP
jgi:ClpX C4-type zinc finger/Clp amino terminal domain, pathogenicity island component